MKKKSKKELNKILKKISNIIKKHKKLILIIGVILIILTTFSTILIIKNNNKVNYSIEIKDNSEFILHFNKNNKVVEIECLNDICKNNKDIKKLKNIKYEELYENLNKVLSSENNNIRIRVIEGKKDISELKEKYQNYDDKVENDIKTEEIKEETKEELQEESNENNNKNNSTNKKETTTKKVDSKTETNINKNPTALDITTLWLPTDRSGYDVKFTKYNKTPMKYKNPDPNDSYKYGRRDGTYGTLQIFNLKDYGITTDDVCVTYTAIDEYKDDAGATTIVPLYDNGVVTYKRYCVALDDVGYNTQYYEITGHASYMSNVYEWKNNTWVLLGILDDITFDEYFNEHYETYYIPGYIDFAYEKIKYEQINVIKQNLQKEYDEVSKELDNLRNNMENTEEWNKKHTELTNKKEEIAQKFDYNYYLPLLDFSVLIEK